MRVASFICVSCVVSFSIPNGIIILLRLSQQARFVPSERNALILFLSYLSLFYCVSFSFVFLNVTSKWHFPEESLHKRVRGVKMTSSHVTLNQIFYDEQRSFLYSLVSFLFFITQWSIPISAFTLIQCASVIWTSLSYDFRL